ncbi:hypothetical protein IT413_05640 [Candidatus Peregrinibacteria bacterium]|nr:hypothetical protein [Candidatus Peregrinibacteria bacterium]
MESSKGGTLKGSGLQAAVLEFVENQGALEELRAFCAAFEDSKHVSPRTIRGTGADVAFQKHASDLHFDSHDFLMSPAKLVEIGIMRPTEVVTLPYLSVGADKKPVLQAAVFMGRSPESKDHVIPMEVRNGAGEMKKMADFTMQDKEHRERFSGTLDLLKAIHLFQLSAVHKPMPAQDALQSVENLDAVYETLSQLDVTRTESLMRSIYQRLFDKPETKAFLEKMKVDAKTPGELRNWIETDGFLNPAVAPVVDRLKKNIEREVAEICFTLKKGMLHFVHGLQTKKLELRAAENPDFPSNIGGVISQRLKRAMGMAPVISNLDRTRVTADPVEVEAAPASVVPASVAPISQAPTSEAPATLASPPPSFEEGDDKIIPIVPTRIISVGTGVAKKPRQEVTANEDEVLAIVFDGFLNFQKIAGRVPAKIGFAHKFEFCDFLLNAEVEIGPLQWENVKAYKLAELFDPNTPAGVNGLLNFFRTLQWAREEIAKKRIVHAEQVREQCSEIFTSLFS